MSRRRVPADGDQGEVRLEVHEVDGGHLKLQYTSSTYRHGRLAAHFRGIKNASRKDFQRVTLLENDDGIQISDLKVKAVNPGDGSYSVILGTPDDDEPLTAAEFQKAADFLTAVLKLPGMTHDPTSSTITILSRYSYEDWYRQINQGSGSDAKSRAASKRSYSKYRKRDF